MNNLSLNNGINSLPATVKTVLWQLVRGDMPVRTFELWVYSNDNNILKQTFGDDSYLELAMLDYKDEKEINGLILAVYEFLIKFPEQCLCLTFPDNTLLYPFIDGKEGVMLEKQIDLLKARISIEEFSGKPPFHQSRWYHPGELSRCPECKTWWFIIFEETEGSDYYLIRLNREEALLILQSPGWPNERWPDNLKNWEAFENIKFKSWNSMFQCF